jgi:hypothetical protein
LSGDQSSTSAPQEFSLQSVVQMDGGIRLAEDASSGLDSTYQDRSFHAFEAVGPTSHPIVRRTDSSVCSGGCSSYGRRMSRIGYNLRHRPNSEM